MKVTPHETYKTYLAIKQHFTNDTYDFIKYNGKIKASVESFHKRKDRLFFEKLSRKNKDEEIVDFFVSNFISSHDPSSLWIGDIIKNGNENYLDWQKKTQSLSYLFEQDLRKVFEGKNFLEFLNIENNKHPKILKEYLSDNLMLETMVILDQMLNYREKFDLKLIDPVWELVSKKIKKYSPFLKVDMDKYKNILRKVLL
ncbi:MAG: Synechococcus phage Bellamy [Bacteroidota bacterium]|jgi:hypothetical protein